MDRADQINGFQQLLAQRTGLRIPPDAHERFVGMLQERAARSGCATLQAYRALLDGPEAGGEYEEFARAFTSAETFFFRDSGQFDLLRLQLLPQLIARHGNDKTLRLWSAGCASGEEAYSLAMLVDMLLPERGAWDIRIFGTDIDSAALAKAKAGRYRQWSFRMVPAAWQQRYFHRAGDEWAIDDGIRGMVTFGVANLVNAGGGGLALGLHDMDLILCRNVFIYFDPAIVLSVAEILAARLVAGGYLMTAHTELMGYPMPELESRLFAEGVVYQRPVHPPATAAPTAAGQIAAPVAAASLPAEKARGVKTPAKRRDTPRPATDYSASARACADRGEYALAEQMCRSALAADPLVAAPYFLLAQLAEIRGDRGQARECLDKAIYLDQRYVAAYLELAALHEREGNTQKAKSLRRTALEIVCEMPGNEPIEHVEITAGELAQWLAQFESKANGNTGINGNHVRGLQYGQ
jgi:chemotaxis protein methyltransferase CheR